MESRLDGESRGYSYGWACSSESRSDRESRSEYVPLYPPYAGIYSSESRNDGESRSIPEPLFTPYSGIYASESRESRGMESRVITSKKATTFLSIDEIQTSLQTIDSLIEKLDVPLQASTTRMKKVVTERGKKIEKLRRLKEEIIAKAREDEEIKKIEDGNDELDQAIKSLRNKLK